MGFFGDEVRERLGREKSAVDRRDQGQERGRVGPGQSKVRCRSGVSDEHRDRRVSGFGDLVGLVRQRTRFFFPNGHRRFLLRRLVRYLLHNSHGRNLQVSLRFGEFSI